MKAYLLIASLASLALLPLRLIGASEETEKPYATFSAPAELSIEAKQRSIIKAALARKWNVVSKKDNQVVINLAHRGYDSTLTFAIKENRVEIFSDSWTVNKKGEKKKKKDPEGWIENIRKDILVFMTREQYQ